MIQHTAADTTDELEEMLSDEQLSEIKVKSVSGAKSYFLRTLLLQGIGLVSALVLSAFLRPEDFGIYGFVTQIIGLLIFVSDIGMAAALIQKKGQPSLSEYRSVFTLQQILTWMLFGLVTAIAFSGFIEAKTGPAGVWILLSLGLSFPLAAFKTISSIRLERALNFSKLVIPQIVEQITFHSLLIVLAWQGYGAMAFAYAIIVRSVLGAVVMFAIEPWPLGIAFNTVELRGLLGFGIKFQLSDFLARLKDNLFFLVLGMILPLREFGYLSWAKNWSMYPYQLTVQNIMAITFPTFSRLQGNKQALKEAIESSLFFISLAIFPILVGMSIFIIPMVNLISRYNQWQPAILSFVLFTLSIGWGAISSPLVNTLNAIGQINKSLKLMVFWTVLTWVLTPILVWWLGFEGVAVASFLIACTSILPVIMVRKIVPISAFEQVKLPLLSALLMALIGAPLLPIWQQSLWHFLLGIIVVGATYLVSFWFLGRDKFRMELSLLRVKKKEL